MKCSIRDVLFHPSCSIHPNIMITPESNSISRERLAAMVAKLREKRAAEQDAISTLVNPAGQPVSEDIKDAILPDSNRDSDSESGNIGHADSQSEHSELHGNQGSSEPEDSHHIYDKYGKLITLNDKQAEFVRLAVSGNSCVLIGAAGTGKTTCQRAVTAGIIQSKPGQFLEPDGHKHLQAQTPGIVICAYTRRAVANIRRNMSAELQSNCITIHKLLEYQPTYYDVIDENTGENRTKMVFEPARGPGNPLPATIHTIIFEESSMIGTDLHQEVIDACPHNVQFIYLGDIQQLPPVFGPAILGFKLLELPVVELTEVYRQALESPIISLAHRILSGNPIPATEYPAWKFPGQLTLHPWKKKIDAINAVSTLGNFFIAASKNQVYDPEEDVILIPYNKSCGTDELNKIIANELARQRNAIVHQIIAGFNKIHLSVGDKVLFDKEDAVILDISRNPSYSGAEPMLPSRTLDYWGIEQGNVEIESDDDHDPMDFILAQVASAEKEERVRACSHVIKLRMRDSETERTINSAADVNALLLGYALTVHKSQGSEWRKVFFCLHQTHAAMISRELLYTGVTRAREELYVICEPETFTNGINSQRVKGNTLEEKAAYFKGRLDRDESETLR